MIFRHLLVGTLGISAAAVAQAQSTVTLYGLLDVAPAVFSRTNAADDRMVKLNSDTGSSSRFGLRGTEDLGGGLSAFFNLESPIVNGCQEPLFSGLQGAVLIDEG